MALTLALRRCPQVGERQEGNFNLVLLSISHSAIGSLQRATCHVPLGIEHIKSRIQYIHKLNICKVDTPHSFMSVIELQLRIRLMVVGFIHNFDI